VTQLQNSKHQIVLLSQTRPPIVTKPPLESTSNACCASNPCRGWTRISLFFHDFPEVGLSSWHICAGRVYAISPISISTDLERQAGRQLVRVLAGTAFRSCRGRSFNMRSLTSAFCFPTSRRRVLQRKPGSILARNNVFDVSYTRSGVATPAYSSLFLYSECRCY
jgi:hypothetical protein